jgi:hypothetical protein
MTLFGIKGQAKGGLRWIYKGSMEEIVLVLRIGDKLQCKILASEIGCLAIMAYPPRLAA